MKVLIISACTGKKIVKDDNQLVLDDFLKGDHHIAGREKALSAFLTPAEDLYSGEQHVRLMKGIHQLKSSTPKDLEIDFWILSAGYGLIEASKMITPYECTFQGMKAKVLKELSESRQIPSDFRNIVSQPYDFALILLGDAYLKACAIDETVNFGGPTLMFCGTQTAKKMPSLDKLKVVAISNPEAKRFSCGLVGLKGELAARILSKLWAEKDLVSKLTGTETDVLSILDTGDTPVKKQAKASKSSTQKPDSKIIALSESWKNSPHKDKIIYFIPEWDDLVNPDYDFITDTAPEGTGDGYETAVYAHQIYDSPPYDGILISKVIVESKKSKRLILEKLGVHRYLRVPREFPIMGDCGAFGYIAEDEPPYETQEILDYYQNLDFDYGVSIDHLIVPGILKTFRYYEIDRKGEKQQIREEDFNALKASGKATELTSLRKQMELFESGRHLYKQEAIDEEKRLKRYNLTINNAKDFIEGHRKGGYDFCPIGAAQGWDPQSYADSVKAYQEMGYTYIALGGLVRSTSDAILQILNEIDKIRKPETRLHLFGVARPDALEEMQRLGIASIDSASFLRRAWLGATSNYFAPDQRYAAIRIPQPEKSPKAKKIIQSGKATFEELKELEGKCLDQMRAYDQGKIDLETVLESIMTYDGLIDGNRNGHEKLIRKTLEDRPWQKCRCNICREKGVEVIIFRGNNRNRRRGFHNTKCFYDQFCHMFGDD